MVTKKKTPARTVHSTRSRLDDREAFRLSLPVQARRPADRPRRNGNNKHAVVTPPPLAPNSARRVCAPERCHERTRGRESRNRVTHPSPTSSGRIRPPVPEKHPRVCGLLLCASAGRIMVANGTRESRHTHLQTTKMHLGAAGCSRLSNHPFAFLYADARKSRYVDVLKTKFYRSLDFMHLTTQRYVKCFDAVRQDNR